MARGVPVDPETAKKILDLLKEDYSCAAVARIAAVSESVVRKLRDDHVEELMSPERKADEALKRWLRANWRWKVPEKKEPVKKKTPKTNFRTPFNMVNIKPMNIYDIKDKQRRKNNEDN